MKLTASRCKPTHQWESGRCTVCSTWKIGTFQRKLAEFWSKVERGDGCWNWTGSVSPNGVARFGLHGENEAAYRVAWMLVNGPIPPGKVICHRCDNRKCVRVDHLFIGTQSDNINDMLLKGRGKRNKLHPSQVVVIRERFRAGESKKSIALDYGVKESTIYFIVTRRTWKALG